jgi:hypothetical protein
MDGEFTLDRPLTVEHKVTLEKFVEERHEGGAYPAYPWCQWVPNDLGTAIQYTEEEVSGYYYTEWLEYLIERFLAPWGYTLNGRVDWDGEEGDDVGTIFVKDNVVKAVDAEIVIRDPFAGTA